MSHTGLSPTTAGDSTPFWYKLGSMMRSYNPAEHAPRFGLIPVRSPLLRESLLLSFPRGTEMFQFPPLARESWDQCSFGSSPRLIAVFHALPPPGA